MSINDYKKLFVFFIKNLFAVIIGVSITYIFYINVLKPIETDKYAIKLGEEKSVLKEAHKAELAKINKNSKQLLADLIFAKKSLETASEKAKCRSKKVSVVFIDGYGNLVGYRPEDRTDKSSNAHYLKRFIDKTDMLSNQMDAKDAVLAQNGVIDYDKVIGLNPDVIVIHRSTFDSNKEKSAHKKIKDLLTGLHERGIKVPIVVFSRTPKTNINYAFDLGGSNFSERIITFQFKEGNPFKIDAHVKYFLNFVGMIGRSQVCKWEPVS